KEQKGQAILIVGHSNTTPDLVNNIINHKVYAPIDDTVFGNLYIITISGNEVSHQLLQGL
ncbi:MAG: phosphoglycerate mutase, partial [Flavobacterium sp.]